MVLKYQDLIIYEGKNKDEIKLDLSVKFSHNNKFIENKISEIHDIVSFLSTLDKNLANIDDLKLLLFYSFLKHEHDILFFLENKEKKLFALFNVEIKNNIQQLKKQMKNHLSFFNKRLLNKNVMFFGVLYVPEKQTTKIYTYENDEMVEWEGGLSNLLFQLVKMKFTFSNDPEKYIVSLDSNFYEKILLVSGQKIELTSHEINLIKSIKTAVKKSKITIVDEKVNFQSSIVPFHLFINKYEEKSDLLILNSDIAQHILINFKNKNWLKKVYFHPNAIKVTEDKKENYLIVIDGQNLKLKNILELTLVYKKIIIFGSNKNAMHLNKINLNKISSDLSNFGINVQYIEHNLNADLSTNKHFDSVLKFLFLPDKVNLDKNTVLTKKINICNNIGEFFQSFENLKISSKEMACFLNFNEVNLEDKFLYIKSFEKSKNITIQNATLNNNYHYVDYLYLVINLDLNEIKKNTYLINNIIRTCNRAQKELHIYLHVQSDYSEIKNKLDEIKANYFFEEKM